MLLAEGDARRQRFIDNYAAAYLAAEASRASEFAELHGTAHSYGKRQPVEDAFFLAKCAWEQAEKLGVLDNERHG